MSLVVFEAVRCFVGQKAHLRLQGLHRFMSDLLEDMKIFQAMVF